MSECLGLTKQETTCRKLIELHQIRLQPGREVPNRRVDHGIGRADPPCEKRRRAGASR